MGKKIELGKLTRSSKLSEFKSCIEPFFQLCKNIKWKFRHSIPTFNTQLSKQIKEFNHEFKVIDLGPKQLNYKHILFFALRQDPPHLAWYGVLGIALKLRGHKVNLISCDGLIRKACNSGTYPDVTRKNCYTCELYANNFHKNSPISSSKLSSFVEEYDWEIAKKQLDCIDPSAYETFTYKGYPVGRYSMSSTVHFLRTGEILNDSISRIIYRDFMIGGIVMVEVGNRIIDKYKPDIIILLNGWFISERIMLELAKQREIRVVSLENGFRSNTLYTCEGKPIEYEIDELWDKYKNTKLSINQNEILNEYLNSRENGDLGWVIYDKINNDIFNIDNQLKLDKSKKIVIAFSSISWDSTLWGLDVGFKNLEDWLEKTITFFNNEPDYQLVVRLHPGEIVDNVASRDSMLSKLKSRINKFAPNVTIIPPTSNISSYILMGIADIGLVYTSTTGLEMAIKGKPVLVAGMPHYRNKGFTFDANSIEEYYQILTYLLSFKDNEDGKAKRIETARRYAYRLFFDGCLTFDKTKQFATTKLDDQIYFNFESIEALRDGNDPVVDEICDRIIEAKYSQK